MEDKFDKIDEILASYEDRMHGIDGYNCTKARRLLREIQNEYLNSKEMPSEQFICPCCGSDETYKTEAYHCSRCAVTTEV